jgi:LacI family transcriptional regulator
MPPRRPRVLISFFWYAEALHRGVLRYGREHGWEMITDSPAAGNPADMTVDAIIGMLPPDPEHPTRKLAESESIPVVELSLAYPEIKHWCRYHEECAAVGRVAAEHLRRLPVRSFAFFDDTPWWNHEARFEGFRETLKDDARPFSRFHFRSPDFKTTYPPDEYLRALPKPCGVFGATDGFAREALDIAEREGFAVPGDLYVMGFGDLDLRSGGPGVPLTSIALDREAWSYAAAGMLDERIAGRIAPGTTREFPAGKLIVRESTGGSSGGDPLCGRALALMRENISCPLTVAQIAKKLGVSTSSLERAFTAALGTGVGRRYLELRMEVAQGLLASGEKAESVAAAVGYASYRSFAIAVRKATGEGPGGISRRGRRAEGA